MKAFACMTGVTSKHPQPLSSGIRIFAPSIHCSRHGVGDNLAHKNCDSLFMLVSKSSGLAWPTIWNRSESPNRETTIVYKVNGPTLCGSSGWFSFTTGPKASSNPTAALADKTHAFFVSVANWLSNRPTAAVVKQARCFRCRTKLIPRRGQRCVRRTGSPREAAMQPIRTACPASGSHTRVTISTQHHIASN